MIDRLLRMTTASAVVAVASVAAIISYQHANELVRTHGESGLTAQLLPFTVDGLIRAASMFSRGLLAVVCRCTRSRIPNKSRTCTTHLWVCCTRPRRCHMAIQTLPAPCATPVLHAGLPQTLVGTDEPVRCPFCTPRESMVVLDASRRNQRVSPLALWSLRAGIMATIGANEHSSSSLGGSGSVPLISAGTSDPRTGSGAATANNPTKTTKKVSPRGILGCRSSGSFPSDAFY